jgi:hypothetical protein
MADWRCFMRGISAMVNILRLSSLIPAGLVVESAAEEDGMVVVSARSAAERRQCPLCGRFSGRIPLAAQRWKRL